MNTKRNYTFKRRMLIIYGLLIVVLVIAVSLIITTTNNNEAVYFSTDTSQTTESSTELTELPETDSFDTYLYASNYDEATEDSDGEVVSGSITFKVALYNKSTSKDINNLKLTINVGTDWVYGTDVFEASTSTASVLYTKDIEDINGNEYSTLSITDFDWVFPVNSLIFIKVKSPKVKLKIEWTEESETTGITKNYEKYIEYSYEDYFVDNLSVGGLSTY